MPLGLTFISTPIIIRKLGTEQYGLYAVILGFLGAGFSTGVGKLAAKYIPEYRAAGSPDQLSRSLSSTVLITVVLGALQAILLSALSPWLAHNILLLEGRNATVLITGMQIAAVTGLVMMNGQVFQFAVQGLHRFDIYSGLTIVGALLSSVGNIVIAISGIGPIGLLLWNGCVAAIVAVLFFTACRPLIAEWSFTLRPGRAVLRQAAAYAGSIVAYQAAASALFAFERSLVVRWFGPESASYYVIPFLLAMYLHAFLASFAQVLFPVVNELLADREKLIAVYLRSTRVVFLITTFLVASYLASGRSFLDLWLGLEFASRSSNLLYILAFAYGFNAISMIVWLIAEAFKAPGINAFSSVLWALSSMPLMLLAGADLGLEGIAGARLVGVILTAPLIFVIERRFLGGPFTGFWAALVPRALFAGLVAASFEYLLIRYTGEYWIVLFAAGLGGLLTFAGTLVLTRAISIAELWEPFRGASFRNWRKPGPKSAESSTGH